MKTWLKKLVVIALTIGILGGFTLPSFAADDNSIVIQVPRGARVVDRTVYIAVKYIDYSGLSDLFNQLEPVKYNKIVIDLFSFGGSVFDSLAMVGLLEEQQRQGVIVEIRARGIVASAGLIIMMVGTPGHRYIDKNTFVMFHEMQTFKLFAVESVSDQEEQAKVNRKIQDKINAYITAKTKLTPQQLSERIQKKELWVDADGAIALGFADKIIGK